MTRSSAEIEREVERQRDQVQQTLSSLRDRMSVSQLVNEAGRYIHYEDFEDAFRNVGKQARDNPLALGLVGAGVAWLMFGNGVRGSHSSHRSRGFYHQTHLAEGEDALADGSTLGEESHVSDRSSGKSSIGSKLGKAASAASDALHSTSDTLRSAYGSGRRGMRDMRDSVRDTGSAAYEAGRHYGGRVGSSGSSAYDTGRSYGRSIWDAVEDEPLIFGACALAVGVAIGAALPSTRSEDRWFGEERDDLMERAKDTAVSAKDQAVGAAKETYETAKKAVSEESRSTGNETIAEKVENVARKTADEAKRQAESARHRTEHEGGPTPSVSPTTPGSV